jgi:hypothetical protein
MAPSEQPQADAVQPRASSLITSLKAVKPYS